MLRFARGVCCEVLLGCGYSSSTFLEVPSQTPFGYRSVAGHGSHGASGESRSLDLLDVLLGFFLGGDALCALSVASI